MSSSRRGRSEKEREKLVQERLQVLLTQMLKDEDNKYCVDCDAKAPRWSSWNIGLFLCIRCAGIHRNLGVHISKVKSVNLDSWTPHQVASMQLMGNSRARAVYEANLPDSFKRPQSDQALEQFIRNKYEKKKYIAQEYVPSKPPDLPEGWHELIEAEKSKKDIRKLVLPSHTHKSSSKTSSPTTEDASTARPKAAAGAPSTTGPASAPATNQCQPEKAKANPSDDILGLGIGANAPSSGEADILGLSAPVTNSTSSSNSGFSDFVSAVPGQANNNIAPPAGQAKQGAKTDEEAAFFSQTSSAATEANKKSTKDSIMALYGQMPAAPAPAVAATAPATNSMYMSNGSGLMLGQQPPSQTPQGAAFASQMQSGIGLSSVQQPSTNLNFGSNNPFLTAGGTPTPPAPSLFNQQPLMPSSRPAAFQAPVVNAAPNQMGHIKNQFETLNLGNGFGQSGLNFGNQPANSTKTHGNGTASAASAASAAASLDPLAMWQ